MRDREHGSSFPWRRKLLALVVAVAGVVAIVGSGGGGAGSGGPLWVETDVKVADVDGDGLADVLTLAMRSDSYPQRQGYLMLYRQTAPGTFAAPLATMVGVYPWRVAVADIDGDGAVDLVITDPDARVTWLLLQDATNRGHFLAPQALFSGFSSYSAVIADLNDDGVPDVAGTHGTGTGWAITVRYQDPAQRGTFGPPVAIPMPASPSELAAGDVDGDGRTDLLAYSYTTGGSAADDPVAGLVVVFQQPGGGFVDSGVLALQVGLNSDRVAIADANGDGRPDLLASLTPWSANFKARTLTVPQIGPRQFGSPVVTSLADVQGIDDAVFADLTGRGPVDGAVAGFWPESGGELAPPNIKSGATLLLNNGGGGFALAPRVDLPIAASRITAGDLDGDGRNDLVLYGDEQVMVMYQSTTPGVFLPPRALR